MCRCAHQAIAVSVNDKTVEVNYRAVSRDTVAHVVIDSTGPKVYGEGEWKTRKHGKENAVPGVGAVCFKVVGTLYLNVKRHF